MIEQPASTVPFSDVVGPRKLSGVDRFNEEIRAMYRDAQDCECLSFRLDGVTYTVCEDPDDGYRSSHRDMWASDRPLVNTFPPVDVLLRVIDYLPKQHHGEAAELLEVMNAATGKTILCVGTGNTNDYYPYFVAEYDPTALAVKEKTE